MLTSTQQRAVDRFAKSLATLGDDSLIDAHHQAWEDHRDARAEGSDNLGRSRRRVSGDRNRDAAALWRLSKPLQGAVSVNSRSRSAYPCSRRSVSAAGARASMRVHEFLAANIRNPHGRRCLHAEPPALGAAARERRQAPCDAVPP